MMCILLFLVINLVVLVIVSIILKLFGVDCFIGQNYGSLLVFCVVFGFVGLLVLLFIFKWMVKMSIGIEVISQLCICYEQWLLQIVEELFCEVGIKMLEVGIFFVYEVNVFVIGWNKNDVLVVVSQGLFECFLFDEVKVVFVYEIGYVVNGDMVILVLIQGVVNIFVMFFV